MTLHDLAILHRYWRRNPPLRVLVACCAQVLGVNLPEPDKPEEKPKSKYLTAEEFHRMVQITGGRIEGIGQAHG